MLPFYLSRPWLRFPVLAQSRARGRQVEAISIGQHSSSFATTLIPNFGLRVHYPSLADESTQERFFHSYTHRSFTFWILTGRKLFVSATERCKNVFCFLDY
ncbi:hypothetical protein H2248_005540 [Termitomyces sp. 'cryptogamus']|nr:hypothetical protein H2248_005540 [Termitomyces sp. 'cryptogamus']